MHELIILSLLAADLCLDFIASMVSVKHGTIDVLMHRTKDELETATSVQAVALAMELGFVRW